MTKRAEEFSIPSGRSKRTVRKFKKKKETRILLLTSLPSDQTLAALSSTIPHRPLLSSPAAVLPLSPPPHAHLC